MATDAAMGLLQDLTTAGQAYKAGDSGARRKLLHLCNELTLELEPPGETFLRTNWAEPVRAIAIRIAIDLDIYKTLSEDGGSPKSSAQLAVPKNADPLLVAKVMRHLAAMLNVREVDKDQFVHTKYSRELANYPMKDASAYIYDDYWHVWGNTVKWLAERGWQHPEDARNTVASETWGVPDTTLFEYYAQHPDKGEKFGAMMAVQASSKTMWADDGAYPVKERLGSAKEDEVLVVDIGGGAGHDLLGFKENHPEVKGRLVLEELPYVIGQVDKGKLDGVELVEHDFYTPQPIKGAHAYFLHQILHDYSDETCRKILQQIKPAMESKSKILVNELVLPEQGTHWLTTSLDLGVMTCLAARERTEEQFVALFESVGLEMTGIWKHPEGFDSVMEVTLPKS